MTLINYPGGDHQIAGFRIDAGYANDIAHILTDAHAVIDDLATGHAPAAARQAAAVLAGVDSGYDLDSLAQALNEVINWLWQSRDNALRGIPQFP